MERNHGNITHALTLQGFKGHQLHHVLDAPGTADLTADVDFSYLRRMAGGGVACLGPLPQRAFLKNMGIDARMQASVWLRRPTQMICVMISPRGAVKGRVLDSGVLCRFC